MITNENRVKRKVQLKHVAIRHQEVSLPKEIVKQTEAENVTEGDEDESKFSADQLAILFICQRGYQSFISILQGVNSTRVPVGKTPLKEEEVRVILGELEIQGYLKKADMHDQTTWTTTAKARALET
jgi:hypothetical protein